MKSVYTIVIITLLLTIATPALGNHSFIYLGASSGLSPFDMGIELGSLSLEWWRDVNITGVPIEVDKSETKTKIQTMIEAGYTFSFEVSPYLSMKPTVGLRYVYNNQFAGYKVGDEEETNLVHITYHYEEKIEPYAALETVLELSSYLFAVNVGYSGRGIEGNIKGTYLFNDYLGFSSTYQCWPMDGWQNGLLLGVWLNLSPTD